MSFELLRWEIGEGGVVQVGFQVGLAYEITRVESFDPTEMELSGCDVSILPGCLVGIYPCTLVPSTKSVAAA